MMCHKKKSKKANADLPIKVKQTLIVFWIDLGIWEKCEVTWIVFYLNRSKKKGTKWKILWHDDDEKKKERKRNETKWRNVDPEIECFTT